MAIAKFQMPDGRIGRFEVPDGTSPEQAQNMIEQSLQETKAPIDFSIPTREALNTSSVAPQKKQSFLEKIYGGLEAGTSLGTSATTGTAAGIYQGLKGAAQGKDFEQSFLKGLEQGTWQPRTEAGKEMTGKIADIVNESGIAGLGAFPEVPRTMPANASMIAENIAKNKYVSPVLNEAQLLTQPIKNVGAKIAKPYEMAKTAIEPLTNPQKVIDTTLLKAIGGAENAPEVIQGLARTAKTPNVGFSAAQATGNAGLAALEDALKTINPTGELSSKAAKNRQALADVIRSISQDENAVQAAKELRNRISEPLYNAEQNNRYVGTQDFENILKRAQASGALGQAKNIADIRGTPFDLPVIDYPNYNVPLAERAPALEKGGLLQESTVPLAKEEKGIMATLRDQGGVDMSHHLDLTGEKATNKSGAQIGVFKKNGMGIDDAVQVAVDQGYLPPTAMNDVDGGVQALRDLIQNELHGHKAVKFGDEAALYDKFLKSMGEPPTKELHPYEGKAQFAKPITPQESIIGRAIKGEDLINLKKGIDDIIETSTGAKKVELLKLKNDYQNWLNSQSRGFSAASNKYAALSRPINQMEVGKLLAEKLIPATSEEMPATLNAAAFAKALQNPDVLAQRATGFGAAKLKNVLTPRQLKSVQGVKSDVSRIAEMQKAGMGYGSPTARRQAVTQFIGEHFKNNYPLLSNVIDHSKLLHGRTSEFLTKGINSRLASQLENMLANDPQAVKLSIKRELGKLNGKPVTKPSKLKGLLENVVESTSNMQPRNAGFLSLPIQEQQ
jgi:hypothetical protein